MKTPEAATTLEKPEFLERVRQARQAYEPSPKTLGRIAQVRLITISGPTGVGKDTVRRKLALPRVVSDTIRPRRIDNGSSEQHGVDYFFRGETGEDLAGLWRQIVQGKFVQMEMGPHKQSFYGTRAKSYQPGRAQVLDVMAYQLPHLRTLPFGEHIERGTIQSFYLVPQTAERWIGRFENRGKASPLTSEDVRARFTEARDSLGLAVEDDNLQFIINEDVRWAVDDMRRIIAGDGIDPARLDRGRSIAASMLEYVSAELVTA